MRKREITRIETICAYAVDYARNHKAPDEDSVQELVVRVLGDKTKIKLSQKCCIHWKAILEEKKEQSQREYFYGHLNDIEIESDFFRKDFREAINGRCVSAELLYHYKLHLMSTMEKPERITRKIQVIAAIFADKTLKDISEALDIYKSTISYDWFEFIKWAHKTDMCRDLFDIDITMPDIIIRFKKKGECSDEEDY